MHYIKGQDFASMFIDIRAKLMATELVHVGTWQSQKIDMPMHELLNVVLEWPMPNSIDELEEATGARVPWAEDHFQERVGGKPLNPSPSEAWWPFRKKSEDGDTNKEHKSEGEAFSHTYPERMWPKQAGYPEGSFSYEGLPGHKGIRFEYGDLQDVVNQLANDPNTRQAYLPIWFPEDTGAVHGKRVPCTLGYHFQIRDNKIHVSYFMRSTDLLRHFQDDVYMAVRLAHWVADEISLVNGGIDLEMGNLVFHTANMHIFHADLELIRYWQSQDKVWF